MRTVEKIAKAEYEAALLAQKNPYEQWIKENETEEPTAEANDSLAVGEWDFIGYIEGVEGAWPLQEMMKDKAFIIVFSEMSEIDGAAYGVLRKAFDENNDVDIIYADEDTIDINKKRGNPWFKPDWSPDTFASFYYFGAMVAYRASFIKKCIEEGDFEKLKSQLSTISDFKKKLRHITGSLIECSKAAPLHITKILTHLETADCREAFLNTQWRDEQARHILYSIDIDGRVAKVSVIIPSKDHPELLAQCIGSLKEKTDYPDYEIIVVDNGSNEEKRAAVEKLKEQYKFTYLYEVEEFNFSRMCNRGSSDASGDLLLFLNDDIEVIKPDWLRIMAGQALRTQTGAVGAKLYYPKAEAESPEAPYRIQHCGITNIALGPVHKLGGMEDAGNIYHLKNSADANMLAVTAACMMIRKEAFDAVGGFDESLAVAYNDVDLCFSLYEKGLLNVVRMDAILFHHESASRGSDASGDKRKRQERELIKLYEKHPSLYGRDPFYSPHLVQERLDVAYNIGYTYEYERPGIFSEVSECRDVKRSPRGRLYRVIGLDPHILYHIDSAERRLRFNEAGKHSLEYRIEGWAAPAQKLSCMYLRYLILEGRKNYRITLFPRLREDTKEILKEQEAWELSGFVARIKEGAVEDGEYKILLSFLKRGSRSPFVMDSGSSLSIMNGEFELSV